jgi:hypothetical protein
MSETILSSNNQLQPEMSGQVEPSFSQRLRDMGQLLEEEPVVTDANVEEIAALVEGLYTFTDAQGVIHYRHKVPEGTDNHERLVSQRSARAVMRTAEIFQAEIEERGYRPLSQARARVQAQTEEADRAWLEQEYNAITSRETTVRRAVRGMNDQQASTFTEYLKNRHQRLAWGAPATADEARELVLNTIKEYGYDSPEATTALVDSMGIIDSQFSVNLTVEAGKARTELDAIKQMNPTDVRRHLSTGDVQRLSQYYPDEISAIVNSALPQEWKQPAPTAAVVPEQTTATSDSVAATTTPTGKELPTHTKEHELSTPPRAALTSLMARYGFIRDADSGVEPAVIFGARADEAPQANEQEIVADTAEGHDNDIDPDPSLGGIQVPVHDLDVPDFIRSAPAGRETPLDVLDSVLHYVGGEDANRPDGRTESRRRKVVAALAGAVGVGAMVAAGAFLSSRGMGGTIEHIALSAHTSFAGLRPNGFGGQAAHMATTGTNGFEGQTARIADTGTPGFEGAPAHTAIPGFEGRTPNISQTPGSVVRKPHGRIASAVQNVQSSGRYLWNVLANRGVPESRIMSDLHEALQESGVKYQVENPGTNHEWYNVWTPRGWVSGTKQILSIIGNRLPTGRR